MRESLKRSVESSWTVIVTPPHANRSKAVKVVVAQTEHQGALAPSKSSIVMHLPDTRTPLTAEQALEVAQALTEAASWDPSEVPQFGDPCPAMNDEGEHCGWSFGHAGDHAWRAHA